MNLDFFKVTYQKTVKNGVTTYSIYPEFEVKPSKDLMIRGGKFYAVINKETGFWETDEFKIQEYVDDELKAFKENELIKREGENAKSGIITVKDMRRFKSRSWTEYTNYVSSLPDHYHQLDNKLCFSNTKVEQKDYISKCLPYPLQEGPHEAWDELIGTLYSEPEREKIEWAIGAIVSGDSKDIQKFIVLYGDPGAGKGTVLKIIQKLFPGYYEMFDAKSLSSNTNNFAFEQFRTNPLIALQTDGDLSRIEDNTKLNSLISHETVVMNEKRKQSYNFTPQCFLFMASNKSVQITDGKSGLIRRLIDVSPTGKTIPRKEYDRLMGLIEFELSGIAWHCLQVYRKLGKNNYNGYKPLDMMARTNAFYNFVYDNYDTFMEEEEGISLENAYEMWTDYCAKTGLEIRLPRYKFKEELKNYFNQFSEYKRVGTKTYRGWYFGGLKTDKFESGMKGRKDIPHDDPTYGLVLDKTESILDEMLKDCLAQYGIEKEEGGSKPEKAWSKCKTTLKDLDTKKLHFILVPKNHIVVDFDLKNEKGEKDMAMNLEAADKWPRTYAEFSQGGKGIHLHYIYEGDPEELANLYAKDIEIKVYKGLSSLRRRLSLCNNLPVARLSGGLPRKEQKDDVIDFDIVKDEMHMRNIIGKCLRKDIQQPYTATAMSLIKKTLDEAWASGMHYDVRDMRPAISAFAAGSHHQKDICMKMANDLHYCGKDEEERPSATVRVNNLEGLVKDKHDEDPPMALQKKELELSNGEKLILWVEPEGTKEIPENVDESLVFFDIEVFPNLLLVNWKEAGEGKGVVRMINPTRSEIADLLRKKLVGFNCRRYDNHVLYARYLGYDNDQIYRLSQRIIGGSANAMFGNAYDISYTDVYDFAAKKQSLKKWEIELGIHHQELGLPWDQPVPEERWAEVAAYCDNDVIATEAVFNRLHGDFKAREILAEIAGMKVNDTTNQLTTKIIFGDDPSPQKQFHYPDLKEEFPGYEFVNGKSYYNGVEIGEGGRVYAVPGYYQNVITFDVASMHPSSIIAEEGFGKYTKQFRQLMDIRIAIKHKDFEKAKTMMDGKLAKYLDNKEEAKALSQALKIAINSVYGLTAAGFDNKFRDPRNKDNWVAKRGALFMETLRLKVTEMGGKVVHIKTDSIKVQNPSNDIQNFIIEYGKQYGYNFEIESKYEKICLVNDAVYIALKDKSDPEWLDECKKAKEKGKPEPTRWTATGAQFMHPYVFKTLFSKEPILFGDLCETKTVTSALYLDYNENLSDVSEQEKELDKLIKRVKTILKDTGYSGSLDEWLKEDRAELRKKALAIELSPDQFEPMFDQIKNLAEEKKNLEGIISKGHNYTFVGKAGSFCPIKPGGNGGVLVREKDGKFYAATGSKGFRWREGESLENADRMDLVDLNYFKDLAQTAIETIGKYVDFETFVNEKDEPEKRKPAEAVLKAPAIDIPPWLPPCGDGKYQNCYDCPNFNVTNIPPDCKLGYSLTGYLGEIMNK